MWGLLAWQDIRLRYRRSLIGPFWITISMGVLVGALGVLYAELLKVEVQDYMPFLALGFIVWGLVSGLISDGCMTFISGEGVIKQVSLPLSVHAFRVVWRNLIIFGHNMVIYVVVALLIGVWPGSAGLLAIPGILLLSANGVWVALLLGLVSARFRDVPQVVTSVMQVAFFLSPIIWKPELLTGRPLIIDLNPFYQLVEVVRAPLLGQVPAAATWCAVVAITALGWLVTLSLYSLYRRRIAYWI